MAVDTAQMVDPSPVDTASSSADALITEPTETGAAVERPESGSPIDGAPTPESSDDSAEDGDESEATTNEDGVPRPSRSERQRQKWLADLMADPSKAREALGPAVQPLIDEALSAREKQAATEAQVKADQAAIERAHQARIEKFAASLGVPDQDGKPGTIAQLQQEIAETNRQIRLELTQPQGIDLDALTAKAAQAEARLARFGENNALAADLQDFIWSQINEGGFARAGEIPELAANPDALRRYFGQQNVHAAHLILAETIRNDVTARKNAEIAALTSKHATELKAIEADRNGWRLRAGGGEATTEHGGRPDYGSGALTLEQYNAMSPEARQKLSSAERDAMMARHRERRASSRAF